MGSPNEFGGSWLSLVFHSPVHSPGDAAELLICPPAYLSGGKVTGERCQGRGREERGQPLLVWPRWVSPLGHVDTAGGMEAQSEAFCQQPAQGG